MTQTDPLICASEHILKLYAGGPKSRADIVEVLNRNPDVDLDDIRTTCKKYRLRGIEPIIKEVRR